MNEPEQTNPSSNPNPNPNPTFDINNIVATAKSIITAPAAYFQSMRTSGGLIDPLIFIIVMSLVAGIISGILSFVGSPVGMLAYGFAAIIMIPIGATIGAFVGAGILYLIWKAMGSNRDYETSFRCLAAISAIYPVTAILYLVPYLGTVVSIAWGAFLLIEASVAVHGRERRTAQLVFGIIAVIMIIMNVGAERTARHFEGEAEQLNEMLEQMKDQG
jgi:hypothetical protein